MNDIENEIWNIKYLYKDINWILMIDVRIWSEPK